MERGLGWEGWVGALILAMLGGIVALAPPVTPGSRSLEHLAPVIQGPVPSSSVQARVWEDPLIALRNLQPQPVGAAPEDPGRLSDNWLVPSHEIGLDVTAWAEAANLKDVTIPIRVLLVEVVDGAGAEDEELRRGERIAIGRGMAMSGYGRPFGNKLYPAFVGSRRELTGMSDRLACEIFSRTRPGSTSGGGPEQGGTGDSQVLLVVGFVPQALLEHRALALCTQFSRDLVAGLNQTIGTDVGVALEDVTIFRRDSRALLADVGEASSATSPPGCDVRVINTGSTIDLGDASSGIGKRDQVQAEFDEHAAPDPSVFYSAVGDYRMARMLGSDTRLSDALVRELQLRRRAMSERHSIALIVDGENPYGQKFTEMLGKQDTEIDVKTMKFEPTIDLPPRSEPGRELFRQLDESGREALSATSPLGMQSTDYIFRQLREYESALESQDRRLSAVMILAYDQHDKRPIIQLVRQEFPRTLVLVLDMHALMTDPSDVNVMRNTIVASHLSLEAGSALQGDYAPFRSCYQTSTFLACQVAFWESHMERHEAERAAALARVMHGPPLGRTYEIGKRGAIMLGTKSAGDEVYYPNQIKRPGFADLPYRVLLSVGIASLALLVYVGLKSGFFDMAPELDTLPWNPREAWPVLVALGALAGASAITPLLSYLSQGGSISEDWVLLVLGVALGVVVIMMLGPGRRLAIGPQGRSEPAIVLTWGVIVVTLVVAVITSATHDLNTTRGAMLVVGLAGTTSFAVFVHSVLWDKPPDEVVPPGEHKPLTIETASGFSWSTLHWRGLAIALTLIALASFGLMVIRVGSGKSGEPLGWLNGVSAWPSEAIRAAAVALGIAFAIRCIAFQGKLWRRATCEDVLSFPWEPSIESCDVGHRPSWFRQFSAADWPCPVVDSHGLKKVDASTLIHGLRVRCRRRPRMIRLAMYATIFSSMIVGAMALLNIRDVPIRGPWLFGTHVFLMWLLGIVLNVCVLVMLDTTILCTRYVNHISRHGTVWPNEVRERAMRATGFSRETISPWLDMQSIAEVTRGVNSLVYYPIVLIVLSATAWYRGIDDWSFSTIIAVLYGLSLPACVVSAYFLRREAEFARQREIEIIEQHSRGLRPRVPGTLSDEAEVTITTEVIDDGGPYVKRLHFVGEDASFAAEHVPEVARLIIDHVGFPGAGEAPVEPGTVTLSLGALRQPEHRGLLHAMAKASTSSERRELCATLLRARESELQSMISSIRNIRRGALLPWSEEPIFRGVAIPVIGFMSVKLADWVGAMTSGL